MKHLKRSNSWQKLHDPGKALSNVITFLSLDVLGQHCNFATDPRLVTDMVVDLDDANETEPDAVDLL